MCHCQSPEPLIEYHHPFVTFYVPCDATVPVVGTLKIFNEDKEKKVCVLCYTVGVTKTSSRQYKKKKQQLFIITICMNYKLWSL